MISAVVCSHEESRKHPRTPHEQQHCHQHHPLPPPTRLSILTVPPGAAEAARQPCAAGHPADQDAPSNLATHPALRGVIDFLRRLPARLLSGRLLIRRAFGLSAGRGVASVLSAAWVIVIARRLSVDQFGEVSVALALVLIFSTVSDLGLQNILARDVVETGRIRRAVLDAVVARRLVLAAF